MKSCRLLTTRAVDNSIIDFLLPFYYNINKQYAHDYEKTKTSS